jgi:hypothetical protein
MSVGQHLKPRRRSLTQAISSETLLYFLEARDAVERESLGDESSWGAVHSSSSAAMFEGFEGSCFLVALFGASGS